MAVSVALGRWLVCLTSASMVCACHGHSSTAPEPGLDDGMPYDSGLPQAARDAGTAPTPNLDAAARDASPAEVSAMDATMEIVDASPNDATIDASSPACVDTCTDLSVNVCSDGKQQGCVKNDEGCRELGERTCTSGRCADSERCLELRQLEWGDPSNNDTVLALSFDGKGSLYVASNTSFGLPYPEVEPGPKEKLGYWDPYLIRMDDQGRSGWGRHWGRPEYDGAVGVVGRREGGALALAHSDGITYGNTPNHTPDFLLARFDPEGSLQHTSYWPTAGDESPTNLGLAPNGDALLVGSTDRDFLGQTNAGADDGVLLRVSVDGSLIAANLLGTADGDILYDVAADADSNAYVVGITLKDSGGALVVNGFIAKVDPTGTVVWQRAWREDELGTPSAMILAHNKLYVVGSTVSVLEAGLTSSYGQSDGFLAQLNLDGDLQWVRQWGGPGADGAMDLALEPSGSLVVVGNTQGGFAGRELVDPQPNEYSIRDVYLLRWSEDGVQLDTLAWGAPADDDSVSSVAVAPDGTIAVGGQSGAYLNGERIIGYPDARVAFISVE